MKIKEYLKKEDLYKYTLIFTIIIAIINLGIVFISSLVNSSVPTNTVVTTIFRMLLFTFMFGTITSFLISYNYLSSLKNKKPAETKKTLMILITFVVMNYILEYITRNQISQKNENYAVIILLVKLVLYTGIIAFSLVNISEINNMKKINELGIQSENSEQLIMMPEKKGFSLFKQNKLEQLADNTDELIEEKDLKEERKYQKKLLINGLSLLIIPFIYLMLDNDNIFSNLFISLIQQITKIILTFTNNSTLAQGNMQKQALANSIIQIVYQTVMLIMFSLILLIINRKALKKVKTNTKWVLTMLFPLVITLTIFFNIGYESLPNGQTVTENQKIINNLMQYYPRLIQFSAVILAPLVEELIFRKGLAEGLYLTLMNLMQKIKNQKTAAYIAITLAIIVSSLVFALIHIKPNDGAKEILRYLGGGFAFGLIYFASNRKLSYTIIAHALWNLYAS